MQKSQVVAVFGLGYVGCVTAACLANLGHRVIGVDKDPHKVDSVQNGRSPFFEPGLDELVRHKSQHRASSATTSAVDAIRDADIVMICVGTPSKRDGNLTTDFLQRASVEIREVLPGRDGWKSTAGRRCAQHRVPGHV